MLEGHINVLCKDGSDCNVSDDSERSYFGRYNTARGYQVQRWYQPSGCSLSNMRRACYILRQETMDHLHLSGYKSTPANAIDKRPMSGFWLCVAIQVNQSIKELSMSHIDLGLKHDENLGKMHILGCFLESNPLLKTLTLNNCYLGCASILLLSRHANKRSANSIEEIDLSYNRLGLGSLDNEDMKDCFLEILNNLISVKRLKAYTGIGRRESAPLADLLGCKSMSNLEELDLSGNDTDRLLLVKALTDNNALKTLNLGCHHIEEEEESIRKQWLQLVCNGSSISSTMKSNHSISSCSEPRDDSRERLRILTADGWMEPLLDDAKLLLSSFSLNHKEYSFHLKTRWLLQL